MQIRLRQGDIVKVEHIKHPVLVVSKDFFNTSGQIIGCPIVEHSTKGPLHIFVQADEIKGYVQCEKLALLDLNVRGYKAIDRILLSDRMNIADAVQGIFEYI
ncbi:MAG: type II toxin-antitoxin system PemK/MazF family toxin [Lachnospiraceae bacterium]|nr:type II toxin-antitoxin system PemK/MazF family toxin [Lachnospiraceae bacterium]